METSENRRLAAILFADIQGYTALMQRDETTALAHLQRFSEALREQIPSHRGQIVQFYGDGCLAIFESSVDASKCAVTLQKRFLKKPRVPVRIGLHVGDVVFRDNNVFGDAVNIASRIEAMGVAGSVLVSESVRGQIKSQVGFGIEAIGKYRFKNVEEPVGLYALRGSGLVVPTKSSISQYVDDKSSRKTKAIKILAIMVIVALVTSLFWYLQKAPLQEEIAVEVIKEVQEKSIAVIPFRDLSRDQDQRYFVDGITEAIRNKLAGLQNLKVTSMTSVLGYRDKPEAITDIGQDLRVAHILEGSMHRDGDKIRVSVNLIRAESDQNIWSQTYDERVDDLFAVQSKIANEVTRQLETKLSREEELQLTRVLTPDIGAYDLFLSASSDMAAFEELKNLEMLNRASMKLERAIEIDPSFDKAYIELGWSWFGRFWSGSGHFAADSARSYADRGLALNPYNESGYQLKGSLAYYVEGNFAACKRFAEKSLELSPNNAESLILLSNYYSRVEQSPEKQLPLLLKAMAIDPQNSTIEGRADLLQQMAAIYVEADLFDKAEDLLLKSLQLYPEDMSAYQALGGLYHAQTRYEEAANVTREWVDRIGIENATPINIHDLAIRNYFLKNYDEAERYYRQLLDIIDRGYEEHGYHPIFRHRLGHILWDTGREEEAQVLFDEQIQLCKEQIGSGTVYGSHEYDIAVIHAFLNQKDQAYQWLEKTPYMNWLFNFMRNDPMLHTINSEPRFRRLIAEGENKIRRFRNKLESMTLDPALNFTVDSTIGKI